MTTELRCRVTNNRCGTDTWAVGKPCQCNSCQHYVTALNAAPVERKAVEALKDALEAIEKWTPPMVVSRIDGRTVSMGSEFGSDGERDYFREVARKALDAAQGEAGPSEAQADEFIASMKWSGDSTEHERALAVGNVRGFAAFLRRKSLALTCDHAGTPAHSECRKCGTVWTP